AVLLVFLVIFLSGRLKELIVFAYIGFVIICLVLWINSSSDVLNFAMERVRTIGTEGDGTSDRLYLWDAAFEMWGSKPIIGIGIGQYVPYAKEMYGATFTSIPHNTYLSF